jgi:hypothetical protein
MRWADAGKAELRSAKVAARQADFQEAIIFLSLLKMSCGEGSRTRF